jgi:HipA-like C-terminal domain
MQCLRCLEKLEEAGHYGLHKDCFLDWFSIPHILEFTNLANKNANSNTDNKTDISSFFHGKFKKYSAQLGDRSFILKMREPEVPELPVVEYLCNQISTVFSIRVAKFHLINFHGQRVFVTENFINHTAPMDLQHIYHFIDDEKYTCENLITIIQQQTGKPYFVDILIKTILFDSLIGNHDRHGRNLGLIVMKNDKSLAPIYDNVSYLALETGDMLKADFNPSGKIATQATMEPSMKDYVIEFKRLGFENQVFDFYEKSSRYRIKTIESLIQNSFCSTLMKQALTRLIHKRFLELEYALKA